MASVPKPPGAKSFFIGDHLGGSGWEVELSNGEKQKFYVQIPENNSGVKVDITLHLIEAPESIREVPIPELAQYYFDHMKAIYSDAREKFSQRGISVRRRKR